MCNLRIVHLKSNHIPHRSQQIHKSSTSREEIPHVGQIASSSLCDNNSSNLKSSTMLHSEMIPCSFLLQVLITLPSLSVFFFWHFVYFCSSFSFLFFSFSAFFLCHSACSTAFPSSASALFFLTFSLQHSFPFFSFCLLSLF